MKNKKKSAKEIFKLRRKAEEISQDDADELLKNLEDTRFEDIQDILHELRVNQIELELQNEELRLVQVKLEISKDRYFDLYNLAPVGYVSLSEKGIILEANLTAGDLLGLRREELVKKPLSSFILKEDQDIYYQFKNKLNKSSKQQTCELRMTKQDGTIIWLSLISTMVVDTDEARQYRIGLNNITERKIAEENILLHNAELERLERLAELEALEKTTEALIFARDENEAMPLLLNSALKLLKMNAGSILLFNPHTNKFRKSASAGWFNLFDDKPHKMGEGIRSEVLSSGRPYLVKEFKSDPKINQEVTDLIPPEWGGVCVPIQVLDETIGMIFLSCKLPRQLQPDEVRLLEAFALIAGITLHRMSLLKEALLKVDNLKAQYKIFQAIAGSYDLQLMLDIIIEQVIILLSADAVCMLLFEPHSHDLVHSTSSGFHGKQYQNAKGKLGEGYAGRAALDKVTIQLESIESSTPPFERVCLINDEGFNAYTAAPLVYKSQLKGVIEVFHRSPIDLDSEWDIKLESLASQLAVAIEDQIIIDRKRQRNLKLIQAYDKTIESWALALDLRDDKIGSYSMREVEMSLKLASVMGISEEDMVHIRRGVILHDIGKLGIPDDILLKTGKLTENEWVIMKQHPRLAYNLLSPIDFLRPTLDIPFSHHEKWDGTGYPQGLKGKAIPLAARIFAVVDVWDALQSDRPFRDAWSEEKALDYIQENSGSHFDPEVVEALLKILQESSV